MKHRATEIAAYREHLLSEVVPHTFVPALLLSGYETKNCRSSSFSKEAENPKELGILGLCVCVCV